MSLRKRQRSASSSRLSSLSSPASPPRPVSSSSSSPPLSFPNADLLLRLHLDPSADDADADADVKPPAPAASLDLHVSSASLLRSRYFAALLSDRWCPDPSSSPAGRLSLAVPAPPSCPRPFHAHVEVVRLLHTLDFAGTIRSPADALDILPVALQLLFDACVEACIRFLEAVPWSDDEEARVLDLAPLLPADEAAELLARVSLPPAAAPGDAATRSPSEAMLHGLIHSAIHGHPVPAATKAFVAMLLKDYPSRDCVHKVLDEAFLSRLDTVKELLGKYASPDFRIAVDSDEREAIQKLNLHSAVLNVKHLLWLIERMVDMRVADNAVKLWSEQVALAADLQKLLNDADMWRNMAPGLPMLVTRCTLRLAHSVMIGETLVPRQVRMKLVKSWLPVLNVCRDIAQPMHSGYKSSNCQELEETFLQIISTLSVPDAQELLQQCLGFSTRNVDDCPHLVTAFKTWFRRASRSPQGPQGGED
ncbi:BTB/POZ domain-containing protein At1g63850-like [Hordeum vulgare subsp. vulgare]|uniref:At3g05675-like ankyrin-like domain-containing protein n=1 Tax=Hordeum vulgare subsp. vulgare TaxID=112509 RepID=A0A8I7BBK9_HORVV|nr:BTB/POZ domain-containing protein At1g63850-like [Hordeum vulgare subsp. vulgare]